MAGTRTSGQSKTFRVLCVISLSLPRLILTIQQSDLDTPLLRDKQIVLNRIDVHALWVSPAILRALGDLPDTVEGGQIVRYESRQPTGVFVSRLVGVSAH